MSCPRGRNCYFNWACGWSALRSIAACLVYDPKHQTGQSALWLLARRPKQWLIHRDGVEAARPAVCRTEQSERSGESCQGHNTHKMCYKNLVLLSSNLVLSSQSENKYILIKSKNR